MTDRHDVHGDHPHRHSPGCGHPAIRHDGHIDYIHDGHLHHPKGDGVEEHRIEVGETNPDRCTPEHECPHHAAGGPGAEHAGTEMHHHPIVPHGDHVDHVHGDRLHHHHGDHCDDHGPVELVQQPDAPAAED